MFGGLYMVPPGFENYAADQVAQEQVQESAETLVSLDSVLSTFRNEVEHQTLDDLKNHNLPLARVKKIMKSDEDVRMISAEAPALFAKACELFILELTLRSWTHTEEGRRRTLHRNDVAACIARTDIYDFLLDIAPLRSKRS
jgi:histone H3/H4